MVTSYLPSFRSRPLGVGVPRKYHFPLYVLRSLSLVPSAYGLYYLHISAKNLDKRDAREISVFKNAPLDFWLGGMWCALSGLWSYWLADGLMRRWLFHYEVTSAMIRLISLQAINWVVTALVASHFGPDEPLWTWIVVVIVFAIANPIQWLFTSPTKYQKVVEFEATKARAWREIGRCIVVPLTITTFITMVCLLERQTTFRNTSQFEKTYYKSDANLTLEELLPDAYVKVIMMVLSSWTENSYHKRQAFRNSTLKLIPKGSDRISIAYRFVLGEAPSAKVRMSMGHRIHVESQEFNDIVFVPTSDNNEDLSQKIYKGFQWTSKYAYDYIIKTGDSVFVRVDTVAQELEEMGPGKPYFWKGLVYWNIPSNHDQHTDRADSHLEYSLPLFPPFTAGALYIMSRDMISLIVSDTPRLFIKDGDQNIGIWLYPHNIKPIHDRRIQQADVCEDDMIAKQFNDVNSSSKSMRDMYENIITNRRLCEGFQQNYCAVCYPCEGKVHHWHDWNFECDNVKGVTLRFPNSEFDFANPSTWTPSVFKVNISTSNGISGNDS